MGLVEEEMNPQDGGVIKCLHSSIDWESRMCRDCYQVFDEDET